MALQLKLLDFAVFLLLLLSFCRGKNVTVEVIGEIHCKDCIRHKFSSNQASLGINLNVFILCNSINRERKTLGNGPLSIEGKFNITLPVDITKDGFSIESCFVKLQSQPTLPCPIQSAQTVSVKILTTEQNTINKPMILKFSSLTCQSAFFFPHPRFTSFHTLPPLPSTPNSHIYLPPTLAPAFQSPQIPLNPTSGSPSPSPSQIYKVPPQIPPTNEPIPPPFSKQLPIVHPPPSKAFHQTPFVPTPILPPIPPPHHKEPQAETPTAPPIPTLKPPTPFGPGPSRSPSPYAHQPLPKVEKPIPPPPNQRNSNPIPRAPPVPQLPPIPPVPRIYFNPPNSKSQPPHSS